jgi:hypothetical protein
MATRAEAFKRVAEVEDQAPAVCVFITAVSPGLCGRVGVKSQGFRFMRKKVLIFV